MDHHYEKTSMALLWLGLAMHFAMLIENLTVGAVNHQKDDDTRIITNYIKDIEVVNPLL